MLRIMGRMIIKKNISIGNLVTCCVIININKECASHRCQKDNLELKDVE
jgi:hypothetical protein